MQGSRNRSRCPLAFCHLQNCWKSVFVTCCKVNDDVRLYESLFVRVLMLASNVRLEIVEPRPPLACCAVTWFRACYANVPYLVADPRRCAVNRLPVTLKVILSGKSLCSSTPRLTAAEGLGVLQVVFPEIYVSSLCKSEIHTGLTVHRTDSSILCRKSDMAGPMTLMTLQICVVGHG